MVRALQAAFVSMIAGVGIGLSLLGGSEVASFGVVRDSSAGSVDQGRPDALTLTQRLDAIHSKISVRADQESAWRRFVAAVTELDGLTRAYERHIASREPVDETRERARHAFLYGAAMRDVDESFSTEQATAVHRLAGELAKSAVCRRLAAQ